jgi:hypothetical protein
LSHLAEWDGRDEVEVAAGSEAVCHGRLAQQHQAGRLAAEPRAAVVPFMAKVVDSVPFMAKVVVPVTFMAKVFVPAAAAVGAAAVA